MLKQPRTVRWERRRLLLPGGAGFIGSHFAAHCLVGNLVERLVVLDRLTYAANPHSLEYLSSFQAFRFIEGDICDQVLVENLLREEGVDCIVNLAAETHVDRSISDSGEFVRSNVLGVHALLEAGRKVWCSGSGMGHCFHQFSTDEVFGAVQFEEGLRDEASPYAPQSPYSASKAAADLLVMAWRNTYGLSASIPYCSNVYGPGQNREKLIPLAISRLLSGQPIPLYGHGGHKRAWIFVVDICRALGLFLGSATEGKRLFLGSETELSNLELLELLVQKAGIRADGPLIRQATDRPGHDRRYGMSSRAFRDLTGFRESKSLHVGLVETINWHRKQRAQSPARG